MSRVNIGCPIWTHDAWFGNLYPAPKSKVVPLQAYSQLFNSVECNSSFYHLPSVDTLLKWRDTVGPNFRFILKIPRTISHSGQLDISQARIAETMKNLAHLGPTLGGVMLQLPKQFSPVQLNQLAVFLRCIPSNITVSVEVRHIAFFKKGDDEKALNQLLIAHQANRVIMDTRALFACEPDQYAPSVRELLLDVQGKKPKVPTHVIATGNAPLVRFVGQQDIAKSRPYYQPWIRKTKQWLDEGKQPSLFFHMPDNKDAPWLASAFVRDYNLTFPHATLPDLSLPSAQAATQQLSIF